MGRLTKRIETEFPRGIQKGIELDEMLDVYEDDMFYKCADKLAHYEDLKEQGRLIEIKNGAWNENTFAFCSICSECGVIVDSLAIQRQSGKLNYCPNCGAKMELKELEGEHIADVRKMVEGVKE